MNIAVNLFEILTLYFFLKFHIVFICVYFSTFFSEYVVSSGGISEWWIGKDWKEAVGLILRHNRGIFLGVLRKTDKSLKVAGLRAEIWTRDLLNTKQDWRSITFTIFILSFFIWNFLAHYLGDSLFLTFAVTKIVVSIILSLLETDHQYTCISLPSSVRWAG
jgi:hypothetical protein